MSAAVTEAGGSRAAGSPWTRAKQSMEFDLNLAPIIDCFTVLIAFVMISTAFASIGVIDTGIMAGGTQAAESSQSPDVRLRINLHRDGASDLKISGKEAREIPVPPAGVGVGTRDDAALARNLGSLKGQWPSLKQATIVADNDVPYQEVVATLETVRKTFPSVSLGGF